MQQTVKEKGINTKTKTINIYNEYKGVPQKVYKTVLYKRMNKVKMMPIVLLKVPFSDIQ